ncbi:actin-like ATPase domain-containing protein [Viridothelium virens]|uniref:Phosphotransferase n=1 Tax=Viridothelium virens TaxID=1048519 RepID=A0A6A6HFL5_VIRVR|nr:actin-like ATPase domain-containing protein [Viridothelium virens]
MIDIWQRLRRALKVVIMLPSLVQAVLPSLSPTNHIHGVVTMIYDRTLDDFLREVRKLFEAPLNPTNLLAISGKLQEQFHERLEASNICMLPSYNHTLPTGHERGTYLALDVGGSTFRVALVKLGGVGEKSMEIKTMQCHKIGNSVRLLEGHAFFDWMAARIQETLDGYDKSVAHGSESLPMGLSWSFPIEQTSIRSGTLLQMGKGFCATHGVQGSDLADLIMQACTKMNLNVRMEAIVNDSTATLLSRAYQDNTTRMALILGTGTNAAIHLPTTALARAKFGERPQSWHDKADHVLVNTEFSVFGKNILPTTRWDDYLNITHMHPDFQPFEHLISGRYLGEIVRLIMLEATQSAGLFDGHMPESLLQPYNLDTGILAAFESDDTPDLSKASLIFQKAHPLSTTPSYADLLFVRQVSYLVSHRAATYLATGIHALCSLRTHSEGLQAATAGHINIGCNGSVIEKYPNFRVTTQAVLDQLIERDGGPKRGKDGGVSLEIANESAIFGAAVAVCCVDHHC